MIERIVVAIDGSLNAEQALPVAAGIARRAAAQLVLLHALDYRIVDYPDTGPQTEFHCENAQDCAQRYLERLSESVAKRWQVRSEINIREGDALPIILDNTRPRDLIVMTTQGRGGIKRMWLGSVADQVMRESHVPTLIVQPHENSSAATSDDPFRHIVVPLDASDLAEAVLAPAVDQAQNSAAKLTLLHVLQPSAVASLPGFTAALVATGGYGPDDEAALASMRDYLDKVRSNTSASVADIATAIVPASSSVANEIVRYAQETGADMLAISTHGHGGLKRLLLGSVADQLVRSSSMPVLVVRPQS
jgi:nucleotide-binding universal stress UspA family protein